MKTCSKCKREKNESEFGGDRRVASGLQARCKQCDKEYQQTYYRKNTDARILYAEQWREKNPSYQKEYDAAYRSKHKDVLKAKDRKRDTGHAKDSEHILLAAAKYLRDLRSPSPC